MPFIEKRSSAPCKCAQAWPASCCGQHAFTRADTSANELTSAAAGTPRSNTKRKAVVAVGVAQDHPHSDEHAQQSRRRYGGHVVMRPVAKVSSCRADAQCCQLLLMATWSKRVNAGDPCQAPYMLEGTEPSPQPPPGWLLFGGHADRVQDATHAPRALALGAPSFPLQLDGAAAREQPRRRDEATLLLAHGFAVDTQRSLSAR